MFLGSDSSIGSELLSARGMPLIDGTQRLAFGKGGSISHHEQTSKTSSDPLSPMVLLGNRQTWVFDHSADRSIQVLFRVFEMLPLGALFLILA